jgi:hypothetical protein
MTHCGGSSVRNDTWLALNRDPTARGSSERNWHGRCLTLRRVRHQALLLERFDKLTKDQLAAQLVQVPVPSRDRDVVERDVGMLPLELNETQIGKRLPHSFGSVRQLVPLSRPPHAGAFDETMGSVPVGLVAEKRRSARCRGLALGGRSRQSEMPALLLSPPVSFAAACALCAQSRHRRLRCREWPGVQHALYRKAQPARVPKMHQEAPTRALRGATGRDFWAGGTSVRA